MPTIAVVGAGPGLGLSIAKRFGREGFAVGLISRTQKNGRTWASSTSRKLKRTAFSPPASASYQPSALSRSSTKTRASTPMMLDMTGNALDAAAGPDWNADTDFDVRLQDVPLNNRRPDVTVYRAATIDVTPTRPEHVILVVEVVSPGFDLGQI